MNMNAVGIDVSKGKSMVAILRPYGEIVSTPFEVKHKPYYVYMTAGANKFLRIYYGRVKEYLSSLSK